ncbi:protein of unknown function [Taphrina deformans PYCC 5710]|uniref:Vacuolar protein sorting-associated protein n=1 Tax=Taphrina deformans (strain PYCC 5710 / ATCC 11124 / CBS 356.35 / IMI 108563 / JCM 9778 / NBRC 8474) TaxID=1097556 RepID=R4XGK2_TAPDE|nr:protein of unknown function [Taphrina deformans PYCC 5710]|eukprot:CCG84915.1 protein of unknown function [Taphrina deformans PYCC 5710]
MLEGLVANLLNRFLGSYIDNFDPKQLNVGIWSGDVKLKNLKLRREALDKFKLPVDVQEGYLGELTLSIPWSNLAKKPVKVHINNVYLLACPKVDQEYDEEDEKRRAQALKQEKLDSAELLNRRTPELSNEESKKSQSFADSMSTKIIDNLQIMIQGVHIRYEDEISSPGNPFSVGLTLSELSATSVDRNWQPTFVQSSENSSYKLAKLQSLALYWNTDTQSLAGKTQDDFIKTFGELISKEQEVSDHQFILRPVNAVGKIQLNKASTKEQPKTDIELLFDEIAVAVDQDQYRDALKMIDTFHFFIRHQEYRKYRPRSSIKDDPKAWLKFAFTSVLRGVHNKNVVWSWDHMKQRRDARLKYIDLYKSKQSEKISLDQSAQLKKLEEDLSYTDIRRYRSLAKTQLKKENALKPKQVAKQAQGWIAWAWSGNHATTDQANAQGDTVMTEEQRKELYDAIEWNEDQALADGLDAPEDAVLLNVSARLRQGSLTLKRPKSQDNHDILQLLFETFGAHFKRRPTSMFADMALKTMRIVDGTTPGSLYQDIVKVKDVDSSGHLERSISPIKDFTTEDRAIEDPLFYASFEDHPLSRIAQSEVVARLKALEIVYNAHCIETLLQFVKPPKSQMESITALMEVAGEAAKDFRESGRASLEFALTEHKTLAAHLDLQAPLIIVPESCTEEHSACIILDAGKIHIESELVQQDRINEIQARGHHQLTDDEMRELQALCYDKFKLRLESTQILISPSVDQGLKALRSAEDRRFHVVDRINMEFLLEISILPKNASLTLTKFRVSGHLPNLSARVSDSKYKTMMRIIDVAIPKDTEEAETSDLTNKASSSHETAGLPGHQSRTFSSSFGRIPDLVVFPEDEHDDAIEEEEEEEDMDTDKFVSAPMNIDEKDLLYRQKIFEFRFTVGELRGSLYKADAQATDDGQLLVDIVLQQFALDFVLRQYDMQADVVLKSFIIEDRMNTDSPPEFQRLITSEQIGEDDQEQKDLVHVKYVQVKPESPEFQSVYGGVDKNVDVALSTINLIVTQKSILTLFDFILTTFTTPDTLESKDEVQKPAVEEDKTLVSPTLAADESKMRVKVALTSIVLVLNQDGIRLATLKMSKGDVGVFLNGPTLRVSAKLGNLSVRDDINQGSEAFSNFRQIISIQGDELVDFQYETFDERIVSTYPGYDSSIYLRLNSVKVNCLEEPLRKIMNFGSKFARMKAIFDDARTAALTQVQQAQERAGKMHFDILIRTPILIFPRLSTQTSERDLIVANLGELFAKNTFVLSDDSKDAKSVNKVQVGIRNISLSSKFHYEHEPAEDLQMIEDADATFDVDIVEHEPNVSVPNIRVAGHVSDIKMRVTQSQYKFLMDLSQSIPVIFTGDELDAEERELEESLSTQRDSRSVADSASMELHHIVEPGDNPDTVSTTAGEVFTLLDADLLVGDLVLELYSNSENSPVGDLARASLTRFSLNKTKAKFATQSDNSTQGELNVQSFTVEDTRVDKNNRFREVIPAIKHDGHQFNASVTISSNTNRSLMAMLTIDTPRMIFSLEYLFELQHWAMSAFAEAQDDDILDHDGRDEPSVLGPQKILENGVGSGPQSALPSNRARSRRVSNNVPPVADAPTQTNGGMSISYRVNIVDPSIILIANSSKLDTDAIVLTAKQLLLTQQTVLVLNIDKAGMYMTKMNELETKRLRILDDFSLTLSMDAKNESGQRSIQIIEADVEPLVLRLSLRDIMLVMQIATTASRLSNEAPIGSTENKATDGKQRRSSTIVETSLRRKSVGTAARANRSTIANQSLATRIKEDVSKTDIEAPTSGITSALVNREELRATFEGLRLVLIGDLHELPMIDVSIHKFTVNVKNWTSDVSELLTNLCGH